MILSYLSFRKSRASWNPSELRLVLANQAQFPCRSTLYGLYSWNMEYLPYPDGSGFEARFSRCGICTLMTELGLSDMIPAMCRLDYTMSEAGGADRFVRQYTLASGGPYCDCGYKKIRR